MAMLKRFWPVIAIAGLLAALYSAGLQDELTFAGFSRRLLSLHRFTETQPVLAPIAYIAVYAVVVALCVPTGSLLSVSGGVLFGVVPGTAYAVLAATLGATTLFLIARTVLADVIARRAGVMLARLRPGLQRDGFSYLLAMRLLPVVPFWLLNLAPAVAGMRLAPFVTATALGIIPATAVYVSLGAGFGDALAAGQRPDLSVIFSARILVPLLALAALSLVPVGWRHWQQRRA